MRQNILFFIMCIFVISCQNEIDNEVLETPLEIEIELSNKGIELYSMDESKKLALNYFNDLVKQESSTSTKNLVKETRSINNTHTIQTSENIDVPVFNFEGKGFVIVNPIKNSDVNVLAFSEDTEIGEEGLNSSQISIWIDYTIGQLLNDEKDNSSSTLSSENMETLSSSSFNPSILNKLWGELTTQEHYDLNNYIWARFEDTTGPILKTKWGQRSPYNDLCPNLYPAGCVAISVGQIINYHKKWDGRTWNWNNINNSITPDISQFIREIGSGVHMEYGADGSHPNWVNINYLTDLNYREVTFLGKIGYAATSKSYNTNEVIRDIYTGYPVILNGFKKKVLIVPVDGHSWIVDGKKSVTTRRYLTRAEFVAQRSYLQGRTDAEIQKVWDNTAVYGLIVTNIEEFFHFNMGWGGTNNGWYYIHNHNVGYDVHMKHINIRKK